MKRFLIVVSAVALMMTACVDNNDNSAAQKAIMEKDAVGVYNGDTEVYVLNEELHQVSTSETGLFTRFQLDDQSKLVSLKFATAPEANKDVVTTINVIGINGVENAEDASMRVLKIEDGKIWLEYKAESLGIVMPW